MPLLQLRQIPAHAVGTPAVPDPLSQGVVRPVVRQVPLDLDTGPHVLLKGGDDFVAGPRVGEMRAVPEPDAERAVFAGTCPVVVGKAEAPGGLAVPAGDGEEAGLFLGKVEVDLGALVDVAGVHGLLLLDRNGRRELHVRKTVAVVLLENVFICLKRVCVIPHVWYLLRDGGDDVFGTNLASS